MKFFRWWFNGKTVERDDAPRAAKPETSVGSLWILKATKNDPFPSRDMPPVRVFGVKDGWVRYGYPFVFTDERMEVDMFLYCYKPKGGLMVTIEFIEAQSERRRVLLEMSDARVCRLSERIRELEAQRELWKKSEEGTLAQMAETNERFEGALSTIRELEAEAGRLRAALEAYADKRHWRVSDSSVGYLDKWFDDDGPEIAQAALSHAEQDGGKDRAGDA